MVNTHSPPGERGVCKREATSQGPEKQRGLRAAAGGRETGVRVRFIILDF